jgi:hypothetical protein
MVAMVARNCSLKYEKSGYIHFHVLALPKKIIVSTFSMEVPRRNKNVFTPGDVKP